MQILLFERYLFYNAKRPHTSQRLEHNKHKFHDNSITCGERFHLYRKLRLLRVKQMGQFIPTKVFREKTYIHVILLGVLPFPGFNQK